MEVRPIDANALMELARNHVDRTVDCNDIARFPTLDYTPVRHGKWCDDNYVWRCNRCKAWFMLEQGNADMNFCPNCGAKMDGGKNNA